MKYLFLIVASLILAPSTEGGICSRRAARHTTRAAIRADRNLLLGDRIYFEQEVQVQKGEYQVQRRSK